MTIQVVAGAVLGVWGQVLVVLEVEEQERAEIMMSQERRRWENQVSRQVQVVVVVEMMVLVEVFIIVMVVMDFEGCVLCRLYNFS